MQTRQRMRIYKIPKQAKGIKGRTRAMWRQFPTAPDVYNPLEPKWQHACIAFGPRGVWRVSRYPTTAYRLRLVTLPTRNVRRASVHPPTPTDTASDRLCSLVGLHQSLVPHTRHGLRSYRAVTAALATASMPHTPCVRILCHSWVPPMDTHRCIYIYAQAHQPKYRTCVQAGTHMYVGSHCNFHLHR